MQKSVCRSVRTTGKHLRFYAILPVLMMLVLSACGSSAPTAESTPEERYRHAVSLLEKKNHDAAVLALEPMMFSTRATALEDQVLFSLATAYYESEQYLLASEIYRRLLQQTPGSRFARDAQMQLAKSFEQLSPAYDLDQEYTVKAINEFQLYLDLYPSPNTTQLAADVEMYSELLKLKPDNAEYRTKYERAKADLDSRLAPGKYCTNAIAQLREKLARNRYSIAQQYAQMKKYRAASMYYDLLIRYFPDTVYQEKAWRGKIDVAVQRKKWFEARQTIEQYLQKFPEQREAIDGIYKKVLANFEN